MSERDVTDLTTPPHKTLVDHIADLLGQARQRTLALCDVDAELARAQIHPLMSPLVWDLAHIGNYEDLWLVRSHGEPATGPAALDHLYNAFEHPRWSRPSLPMLELDEARDYVARVRRRSMELLATADLEPSASPLFADGFVYGMVIQHEHQHDETLLAAHQLRGEQASLPPGSRSTPVPERGADDVAFDDVAIDGGEIEIGASHPWAYDNERPVHRVFVEPFRLDRHPITNARFAEFIDAGGYDDPRWWSADGWMWRTEHGAVAPLYWRESATASGWEVLRFGTWTPTHPAEPVQHVSWYEADAFARWAGRRLPTEYEWELAATWHPSQGKRTWPWGNAEPAERHANLGQRFAGPLPAGSHPDGANPWGIQGLIGDVWEWTSTTFGGHRGFQAFPYPEYSEAFFGNEYRVLRGGSWATHPVAVRGTFRNWDYPMRRQIFAGLRTAADVAHTPRSQCR